MFMTACTMNSDLDIDTPSSPLGLGWYESFPSNSDRVSDIGILRPGKFELRVQEILTSLLQLFYESRRAGLELIRLSHSVILQYPA